MRRVLAGGDGEHRLQNRRPPRHRPCTHDAPFAALMMARTLAAATYIECALPDGRTVWGVGIDEDVAAASVRAIISAANGASCVNGR